MEAKEKAKELFFAMLNKGKGLISDYLAKQCALVMVTEIMEECLDIGSSKRYNYWQKVKTEIEKL